MAHIRAVKGFGVRPGYCSRGVRVWMERQGIDYSRFLREGIDESVLLASGDPLAIAVVRQANGQQ